MLINLYSFWVGGLLHSTVCEMGNFLIVCIVLFLETETEEKNEI